MTAADATAADAAAAIFEEHRARLFGIAYRMLGSVHDAEEVVQDAFLRWHAAAAGVEAPGAWLATVVTNLCLNRLARARRAREDRLGTWQPEPVLTTNGEIDPQEHAELRESVSLALLVTLERLTPAERAAFVLREAFGYPHADVARILHTSEVAVRQLVHRARVRIDAGTRRFEPPTGAWRALVERFLAAADHGDLAALESLLAADVVATGDTGRRGTARRPIVGRARIARYVVGIARRWAASLTLEVREVNGQPAILGWRGGELLGVMVLEMAGEQIVALRTISQPARLVALAARHARLSRPDALSGS